ncbi:unnamed protein product [Nezara viridula]|uniref:Mitoguardin n=1 Tax=Nezara viridula TaxID=85310 RepID=A0A9P0H5I9_NEZVI|nr:unnamed protein product [Nezara viridula]
MSKLTQVKDIFFLRTLSAIGQINLSRAQKVLIISVCASATLLGVVAHYMKRRKSTTLFLRPKKSIKSIQPAVSPTLHSPDEDISRGLSPLRTLQRQPSVLSSTFSEKLSAAGLPADIAQLTPQQLGVMGMEALEKGIGYWEDALAAYQGGGGTTIAITDREEAEFSRDIETLLEGAYRLQRKCELLFLDQRSVLFRAESSVRSGSVRFNGFSSAESFVSAQDEIADLREFEEYLDLSTDVEKLPFYQAAVKQFEEHGIPYRCLRTEMVHCSSDLEYLCKLHCVRLAFSWMFQDKKTWDWFADSGRQVLTDLILYADKDPKDFIVAFEEMLIFLQDDDVWSEVERELSLKGVKAMTFFDVVLDYILMDAFEDLESPPSSVTAVVQNRWLSNGFKESALATAVWSVLKAKRRMLVYPSGFMSHFYSISEQLSPLLAWGFLGPNDDLHEMCLYFKDQVMNFLMDIFSFQKSNYMTVETLSEDILRHVKTRVENIEVKLARNFESIQ